MFAKVSAHIVMMIDKDSKEQSIPADRSKTIFLSNTRFFHSVTFS
jgi:hypothetical protein